MPLLNIGSHIIWNPFTKYELFFCPQNNIHKRLSNEDHSCIAFLLDQLNGGAVYGLNLPSIFSSIKTRASLRGYQVKRPMLSLGINIFISVSKIPCSGLANLIVLKATRNFRHLLILAIYFSCSRHWTREGT